MNQTKNSFWNTIMTLTKRFSVYLLVIGACLVTISVEAKSVVKVHNDGSTALANIFELTETNYDSTLIEKTLNGMRISLKPYRVAKPFLLKLDGTTEFVLTGLSPRSKIVKVIIDCKAGILPPLLKETYKKLTLNMLPAKIIMQFIVDDSMQDISIFDDIIVNQILNYDHYTVPAFNLQKGLYLKIYFIPRKAVIKP